MDGLRGRRAAEVDATATIPSHIMPVHRGKLNRAFASSEQATRVSFQRPPQLRPSWVPCASWKHVRIRKIYLRFNALIGNSWFQ
jgi:hypothetical protein